MPTPDALQDRSPATWPFLAASLALHLIAFLLFGLTSMQPDFELQLPDDVEIGLVDGDPGEEGSPPPAAAPEPEPEPDPLPKPVREPRREPEPVPEPVLSMADAGVLDEPDASVALDGEPVDGGAPVEPGSSAQGDDGLVAAQVSGRGQGGVGEGLGFGAGGFGSGRGGPLGAVIGLHADLDAIRDTSLILEARALLDIIPQWQAMLAGSGIDPLEDFSRIFVATPNLKRSHLVLSAQHRRDDAFVRRAAEALARERKRPLEEDGGMLSWHSRGPTRRVLRSFGDRQLVIARKPDVRRVAAVGAALSRRHARQPGMERLSGEKALLAMYEGEAAALSVEGVATYVPSSVDYAPKGLRLSLRHLDEFHAALTAYGYYGSAAEAEHALAQVDALRLSWLDHRQVRYLGLRSALEEAEVTRVGATLMITGKLTMHQTRYLLGYVSRVLNPRK
jgi:hypothetical protein